MFIVRATLPYMYIHAFNMIQPPISKRAKPKPDPTNGSGDVSEVEPFTLLRGGVEELRRRRVSLAIVDAEGAQPLSYFFYESSCGRNLDIVDGGGHFDLPLGSGS